MISHSKTISIQSIISHNTPPSRNSDLKKLEKKLLFSRGHTNGKGESIDLNGS
jgi:hypothetical protein